MNILKSGSIAITLLILLLQPSGVQAQSNLPEFFDDLFIKFLPDYQKLNIRDYQRFCEQNNLDKSNIQNQKQFYKINFYHDLFTGNGASNYVTGGMLKIPYVWHWVDPNPRHSIMFLPDSTLLSSMKPPPGFGRYKTFADLDRVPFVYFSDLVSERPAYYHRRCGSFYTFGWCSEREMAFSALMTLYNYDCKIKQEGIHTWSEIWLEFKKSDGSTKIFIVKVDNTFNIVDWTEIAARVEKAVWQKDYGNGTQVEWYNNKARSKSQIQELNMIIVSNAVKERIEEMVNKALN